MNHIFDKFIMVCIVVNTSVFAIMWYGQSKAVGKATDFINYVFTGIFAIEVIIKTIAFGGRYFKDGWNVFDFIIAIGSIVGSIIQENVGFSGANATNALRCIKIGRIFKFFRKQ